jgi:NSS family neurotransmitter:Na+ symporter
MIEMASRLLMDLGFPRGRAIGTVGVAGLILGIPSALKLGIFQNQDWVWGVALMVSGFFFAFAVLKYGVTRFRETFINQPGSDVHIGPWWDWAMRLVAFEAVFLAGWFLWSARSDDFRETWTLFSPYNVGSVVIQFVIVLIVLLILNKRIASAVQTGTE